MYYTSGFHECLSNLVVLASTRMNGAVRTEQDLATGLRNFIAATNTTQAAPGPLHIVDDEDRLRTLARQFGREPADRRRKLAALPEMVELFQDALNILPPQAQRLFRLLVTEVALFDSEVVVPGSGALVEQVGSIYIAVGADWTASDVAECLVHEMTHLLLRCDEHRYGHYVNPADAVREQKFSRTAVSLTQRSPMVAFHSLVVAAEIMGLRSQLRGGNRNSPAGGAHGPDKLLVHRALQCADELLQRTDRDNHYRERAIVLMEHAATGLRSALPEMAL
ncbi:hypothetical protein J7W19_26125 [Streptomyces mobaraensis NBRC 13819 = DSM 40847]|uniref:aKG-HExxH-type peptide beta-hydroxylase n=1 Tax=Streptomyces mobaraensis TaxID=35621 RepID=UPI000D0AAF87|nr:HEXXH motif-containing putative peptide modification protein [Streptomyces mobaraensis]QTT76392.1 hypothetical protein J7W19_26125 [Streptomyces mobaraensis NBRC 13819 = DSM 40847]